MTPVCVSCRRIMSCSKTGRKVEVLASGRPYELWSGDEYTCRECGAVVVATFARECLHADTDAAVYAPLRMFEAENGNLVVVEG